MKNNLILFISLLLSAIGSGQKKLTKDEIFSFWIKDKAEEPVHGIFLKATWADTVLQSKTTKLVDSLYNIGIDSIIIYTVAYPGHWEENKCQTSITPVSSHVIWKSDNQCYEKKLVGRCEFNLNTISSNNIFDFYNQNYSTICYEIFMPIITEAELLDNNTVNYSTSISFHDSQYSIIFKIGNNSKKMEFTQYELDYKESLFYKDNLNLKSYHLWQLIKKYLNQ